MSVDLVTEVTTLEAPTWNGSQWVRSFGSDETVLPDDSLVVLVGGGSHVIAHPGDGWLVLDDQLGQEAQGFVMSRRFTADPEATTWTVAFDGNDKALVSVLHFRGQVTWVLDGQPDRVGTVGVTLPAGTAAAELLGQGDMEFYFVFARNAFGVLPSADGTELFGGADGNETGVLYQATVTSTDPREVDVPARTGHYFVALNASDRPVQPEGSDGRIPAAQVDGLDEAIAAGAVAASRHVHHQSAAAALWTITHDLGTKPAVVLICDTDPGVPVYADLFHINDNQLTITLPSPESGWAYLS